MGDAVSQPKLEPVEDRALFTSEDPPDGAPSPSREVKEVTAPATMQEDAEQRIENSSTRVQDEHEQPHDHAMPIQVPDITNLSTSVKSRPEDALSQDEHPRNEKPTTKKRGKAKTVWFGDVEEAFVRAVHLLPNIGTSRKLILGQLMQRMDMIAEYIRRQTGVTRTVSQVRNHVANVKATSSTSAKLKAALTGYITTPAELDRIDWDVLLGPDHFPHTKPRASNPSPSIGVRTYAPIAAAPSAYGSGRPAKVPKLEHDTTLSYAMPPPAPVPHPGLTLPFVTPSQGQTVLPPFYPQAYPQVPVAPPFAYCPPPPAPHTAYPPPAAPSTHTSMAHSFLSPLLAFLSASSPGRDHSLAAHALLEGGVTSLSALADLLLLEQNSLDGFFELLSRRTRVAGMQLAWLKKAVAGTREASVQAG
ncbi:Transketolase [Rhodotorula kratochvilovae]